MQDIQSPAGHPISPERARELMAGPLADVYRSILKASCAPIYWYACDRRDASILSNGTVTFLRTPERILGVTAAHVVNGMRASAASGMIRIQLLDADLDDIEDRIISVSDRLDIATFSLDDKLLKAVGKEITPLANWPPQPPQEGRGIMLAGYPGIERAEVSGEVEFGLFTALVIARTVSDIQITWLIEPDAQVSNAAIPPPPAFYGLGGVSGGPLITWLESEQYIATFALGGIITEHPNYGENDFSIERVIATRADFISPSGRILHGG